MTQWIKDMEEIQDDMVRWRRALHQIPELQNQLPRTADYIAARLKEIGIEHYRLLGNSAVVGLIHGREGGRTIALRADMDALPIQEETALPFASRNGKMHACGHDAHMAILLGAAKMLHRIRDQLQGKVKLIFQPGEEYPGGALPMIQEGVLEDPKVDAILGLHNGQINPLVQKGNIGIAQGCIMASMDRILLTVKGKGAHGAYPEQSIDPIVIAANIVMALQTVVSRCVKATDEAVVSICRIHGGVNQNIIPDQVELEGTVRASSEETQSRIEEKIRQIAAGIAVAHGGSCEIVYERRYPPLVNDRNFTEFFKRSAMKRMDVDQIQLLQRPVMAGEDMAFFLKEVPGTYFFLSNPKEVDGQVYPHHSSKFDVDESGFRLAAELMIQTVVDFLDEASDL